MSVAAAPDVALWLLAAGWAGWVALVTLSLRWLRELPPVTPGAGRASVSIIVAARNEARRIGITVERLLAQRDVDLELIVVDDRSSDETGAILDLARAADPRLRVVRVDALPEGWLGKPHACHVGAAEVRGEWLLFADADVWLEPDVVARAVQAADEENAQHVSLLPGESQSTPAGGAALLCFYMGAMPLIGRVNRDRTRLPVGVGAFNLVRAKAYRSIDGHQRLRMELIDDAKLGLLLLRAGYRTRVLSAHRDVEVRWAGSLPGFVRALEKNMFSAVHFSFTLAALAVALLVLPWLAALLAPLTGRIAGWFAAAAVISMVVPSAVLARRIHVGLLSVLLAPLVWPTLGASLAHSAWSALQLGGVRWRETVYPIEALRRGRVPLHVRRPDRG